MQNLNIINQGDISYVDCYLHDDDDEFSDLWPLDAPQQEEFHNALYEVKITLVVDMTTGKSEIFAVDDRELIPKETEQ